ncbi:MAG TPA: M67 family metallopeptidase [Anaerolineales bacterium]
MNQLSNCLYLHPSHWADMEAHVSAKAPEEACGIVAGKGNYSHLVIPVTNMLHSPFRFRMEPREELEAFLLAEEKGLEILAIYHSHPQGINKPSVTDLEEVTFLGIIYLIWYMQANKWECRGYLMKSPTEYNEVPVIISDGSNET